ncbi:MAG: hypothetical protein A8273_379 [Methanohalophilus sp. 2-GBenrich]|nr:MAG: hypothetical protein A8273_379 [Methanohalophilus sp. 2-GBenrich]
MYEDSILKHYTMEKPVALHHIVPAISLTQCCVLSSGYWHERALAGDGYGRRKGERGMESIKRNRIKDISIQFCQVCQTIYAIQMIYSTKSLFISADYTVGEYGHNSYIE